MCLSTFFGTIVIFPNLLVDVFYLDDHHQVTAVIIVSAVSFLVLAYCIANGTKILNVFNPAVSS